MEASQFFKDEQKRIIGLSRQALTAPERAPEMSLGICKELVMALEVYLRIKKEMIYPLVSEVLLNESENVDRSLEESLRRVKPFLQKDNADLVDSMTELTSQVEEYFETEEHKLLPFLKGLSAERLRERQTKLLNSPKYSDARPEIVQNPRGGEQRRKRPAV